VDPYSIATPAFLPSMFSKQETRFYCLLPLVNVRQKDGKETINKENPFRTNILLTADIF
jgi:hypothetical protein